MARRYREPAVWTMFQPSVTTGQPPTCEVVRLFAFDVANDIATARVQSLFGTKPERFDLKTIRKAPAGLPPYRPIQVVPEISLSVRGQPVRAVVRVYDVGVVTVALRAAIPVGALGELRPFHEMVLDDGRSTENAAKEICRIAAEELLPVTARPSPPGEPESYTVFGLTDLGGDADVPKWLDRHRREVAGLLGQTDPDRLSEAQVAEILRLGRSYEIADAVVVDWDAALVVDLGGGYEDVLYVLELANFQLEELRWMDRYLDAQLDRAYADLGRTWTGTRFVLRSLRRLRVDLAKLADEVANVTKFIGDWHLARVYLLARERFHLDQWRDSVERRLGQLDHLYTLVRGERHNRQMLLLEILVVICFLVDIALLVIRRS